MSGVFEIQNAIMNYVHAFPVCRVRCRIWNSFALTSADDQLLQITEEEDESTDIICRSSSIKVSLVIYSQWLCVYSMIETVFVNRKYRSIDSQWSFSSFLSFEVKLYFHQLEYHWHVWMLSLGFAVWSWTMRLLFLFVQSDVGFGIYLQRNQSMISC